MNPVDTVPLMLLALHLLALGVGTAIFFAMIVLHRRARDRERKAISYIRTVFSGQGLAEGPAVWLAVRSTDSNAVLAALRLKVSAPCPSQDGGTGLRELCIGPAVDGWILVTGRRLPQPVRDVDACFHFLVRLSRVLGHVQFFMTDTRQGHHAWVRAENGVVRRAYAWVNETVWDQGPKTPAEIELNMKCFNYGESTEPEDQTVAASAAANVEKVPALAARWSFDAATVPDDAPIPVDGVAGEPTRSHQD